MVAIFIFGVLCGTDSREEIQKYGRTKEEWLSTFLVLLEVNFSHETFNKIISSLSPLKFEECFNAWVSSLIEATNDVILIDGKTKVIHREEVRVQVK
jgi:hypothetical protein